MSRFKQFINEEKLNVTNNDTSYSVVEKYYKKYGDYKIVYNHIKLLINKRNSTIKNEILLAALKLLKSKI